VNYYKNKEKLELVRKLKIGDKVKIKSKEELEEPNSYPLYLRYGLVSTMLNYAGKEFRIERVIDKTVNGGPFFLLKGTKGYYWSVYLFDFSEEKSIKKYSLE
jgi:hypothetical protein